MPKQKQNLQKSFQVPAQEKRNLKKSPPHKWTLKMRIKTKIKHESTTKPIRNALRDTAHSHGVSGH
jgi:hypothetical protein